MVFVKVRETYDLHTTRNKMTVIGIHTPKSDIIKRNYPGLLMQCKAYRPVSCDVRLACASLQPLDPLGVGTTEGDVAPEDVFNPILYKAMSNKGMSQLEARINFMSHSPVSANVDVDGDTAAVDVDSVTTISDEFNLYYGLLANTHEWKHANPQSGLSMTSLKPFVYEVLYNVGDVSIDSNGNIDPTHFTLPGANSERVVSSLQGVIGRAKEMPFINCTSYSLTESNPNIAPGFPGSDIPWNASVDVPWINVVCGCIIVPPSRLHELFYRMVVEWTIEFSGIRPISEISSFASIGKVGTAQHYQNYDYSAAKKAITGSDETILTDDSCMVSANVDINKVM